MKASALIALLALSFAGTKAMACGSGPCAAGFEKTSDGSVRVRDFTPSNEGGGHVTMSTQNALSVERGPNGELRIRLDDGSLYIVYDIGSLEDHDLRDFDPDGPMNFFPTSSGTPTYTYYVRSDNYHKNLSDSDTPFGRTVYRGTSCTGSCRKLMGNLDSVALMPDGSITVAGWACDRLVNKPIDVHVYAGGAAGQGGTLIGAAQPAALKMSDAAKINALCGTSVGHRFRVKIPMAIANKHRGKKVYVHGISAGPNFTITGSGGLTVPKTRVNGWLDSVGTSLKGWACDIGINKSVNVHVYVGGPAGQGGQIVLGTTAKNSSASGVAKACGTTLGKHRFDIKLTAAQYKKVKGKKVYIHAISTTGGPNYLIGNSGLVAK